MFDDSEKKLLIDVVTDYLFDLKANIIAETYIGPKPEVERRLAIILAKLKS